MGLELVGQGTTVQDNGSTLGTYHLRCGPGLGSPEEVYEVHGVHAFTSTRKRMSLVLRAPDGQYWLYAKGADMMMVADCDVVIPAVAHTHMQSFAAQGLRTLVVAQKRLSASQFQRWRSAMDEAGSRRRRRATPRLRRRVRD
jgi:magnesium-transporting ATPase (P-type)